MSQVNVPHQKNLCFTINLTQGKHESENGVRPKTL